MIYVYLSLVVKIYIGIYGQVQWRRKPHRQVRAWLHVGLDIMRFFLLKLGLGLAKMTSPSDRPNHVPDAVNAVLVARGPWLLHFCSQPC